MSEYLVFDCEYKDIPEDDVSGADLVVCLYPEHRFGAGMWVVMDMTDAPTPRALFWDQGIAADYAYLCGCEKFDDTET